MIADEGCAERGCPMHDSMWTKGVQMVEKKEWVGLTDEEIEEGQKQSWVDRQAFESAVWWAEAKLKEKNAEATEI